MALAMIDEDTVGAIDVQRFWCLNNIFVHMVSKKTASAINSQDLVRDSPSRSISLTGYLEVNC